MKAKAFGIEFGVCSTVAEIDQGVGTYQCEDFKPNKMILSHLTLAEQEILKSCDWTAILVSPVTGRVDIIFTQSPLQVRTKTLASFSVEGIERFKKKETMK